MCIFNLLCNIHYMYVFSSLTLSLPPSSPHSLTSPFLPPSLPSSLPPAFPPFLFPAALEASPPGTFDAPHSVVAEYNQPWVLSCGSLTSIPTATYNWDFQNSIPFIEEDHAIIGKNDGLLYLQLVTETPPTFVCTMHNAHIDAYRTGYVQLTVQGSKPLRVHVATCHICFSIHL